MQRGTSTYKEAYNYPVTYKGAVSKVNRVELGKLSMLIQEKKPYDNNIV